MAAAFSGSQPPAGDARADLLRATDGKAEVGKEECGTRRGEGAAEASPAGSKINRDGAGVRFQEQSVRSATLLPSLPATLL